MDPTRIEHDLLGELAVPRDALYGIHAVRAAANFPLSGRPVHRELVRAYGWVKLACVRTNASLGWWADDPEKLAALERACQEMAEGLLTEHIIVDALQGGAGTSTNLCVSEVLANRALALLGLEPGRYDRVSPTEDLNLHQSTNDTFPTALKLAAIRLLRVLETEVVALQEAFQAAERRFAHVVKVGRTEMQDAVLTTLGRSMGAFAEALSRDRWRIYKCEERLRTVNLGGTAIGTGLGAPRDFIFRATDTLRELTGVGLARAENLVEATQNADAFAEVSGILRTLAVDLWKIAGDLRLMSSGPDAGLGELHLPERQAGSSIMPGKVNPVIPEAVTQVAMRVLGHDQVIAMACANGSLELNPFLPLVADCLLESEDLLIRACAILREGCVEGVEADEERCRAHVDGSTALLTALVCELGYERVSAIAAKARAEGRGAREVILAEGILTGKELAERTRPEAICRLGEPRKRP